MKKIILMVLGLSLQFCIGFAAVADYSSMSSKELNYAFILAVKNNTPEIVQELVQAGADVNQKIAITGSHGRGEGCMDYMIIYTPLEYAAIYGYVDIVGVLIKAGAVIYADHPQLSNCGLAALIGASRNGHVDVVRALIKAGADVNHTDRGTRALYEASREGHVDVVRALIRAGADVNHACYLGIAIIAAADRGHVDVVRALIKAGANVNLTNQDGDAALIGAAREGHVDVVRALIKAGANVNQVNQAAHGTYGHYMGNTALIEAAGRDHVDVVRALIKADAHVNLTNKNGDTALMCAIRKHHFDVVQSILQSPEFHTGIWQRIKDLFSDSRIKSINYADKNGNTALMLAIKSICYSYYNDREYKNCVNGQKIVEELLKTPGIDLHHVNNKGEAAITLLDEFKKKSS